MADNKKKATYDLIINGETANKTLKDLEGAAKSVRAQFKLTTDPADQEKLGKAYQRINEKISEQNNLLKGTSKATEGLKSAFGELAAAAGLAYSLDAVKDFAVESLKEFGQQQKNNRQLLAALDGRKDAQERLLQSAERLKVAYNIDDDIIVGQQKFLAAQGRTELQIENTIKAAIQLSAVTGEDLDSAVKKLDATFEGSSGKLGKLDERFKDLTETQLRNGAAIDLVNEKYKGFAEEGVKGADGAIEAWKIRIQDFKKEFGAVVSNMLESAEVAFRLAREIGKRLLPSLFEDAKKDGIPKMSDALQEYYNGVEATLKSATGNSFNKISDDAINSAQQGVDKVVSQINNIIRAKELALKNAGDDEAEKERISKSFDAAIKKESDTNLHNEELRLEKVKELVDTERKLRAPSSEEIKKITDAQAKFNDETEKLLQQTLQIRTESIEDQYSKELTLLQNKYENERAETLKQKINKPNDQLSAAELKRNAAVNAKVLALDEAYVKERGDIFEKAGQELNEKDFKDRETALKVWLDKENGLVIKQLARAEITEEQANTKQLKNQLNYLTLKLLNLKAHHQETAEAEKQVQETIVKLNAATIAELTNQYKDSFGKLGPEQKKRAAEIMQQMSVLVASGADTSSEAFKKLLEELASIYEGAAHKTEEFFKRIPQWLNDALRVVGDFANQVGSVWESVNQIADNKDRKRLQSIHTNAEKERAIYDKLLKNKQISQSDYQKHIEKLDQQEEKANKKASREAAIRGQRMAVFRASLNAFQAISTTLAEYPFPINIALAALTAFAAFKQVQAIKSEPLPEAAEGTILKGPKHNSPSRGITVTDSNGVPIVKAEGGELIGSAAFVEQNPELAAAIVASGKNGGRLSPSFLNRNFPSVNIPAALQASSPGFTNRPSIGSEPLNGKAAVNYSGDGSSVQRQIDEQNILIQKQNELLERMHQTLDKGISAKFVYREFKKDIKRVETITGDK